MRRGAHAWRGRRAVVVAALAALASCTAEGPSSAASTDNPVVVTDVTVSTAPPTSTPVVDVAATTTSPPTSTSIDVAAPIRAAFYYPWFPENWMDGSGGIITNFHPAAELYDSSDLPTIVRHLDELTYAHVDVAISSWWGKGSPTADRFDSLLAATTSEPVRWALYYEPEGYGNPSSEEILQDLGPTIRSHGDDAKIFRIDGRFVVFVYGGSDDDCDVADRWAGAAESLDIFVVLKVFSGYRACASQPDAWHQYAPANAVDAQLPWSYSVSPGFWLYGDDVRLARDPSTFRDAVSSMVLSGATFQLITTFNEWGEGTAVEPAIEWSSSSGYGLYLDILHDIPPRP